MRVAYLIRAHARTYIRFTASKLRSALCTILDRVLETGEPIEVTRSRDTVIIKPLVSEERGQRARRDPDEFIHFDWVTHWKPRL